MRVETVVSGRRTGISCVISAVISPHFWSLLSQMTTLPCCCHIDEAELDMF